MKGKNHHQRAVLEGFRGGHGEILYAHPVRLGAGGGGRGTPLFTSSACRSAQLRWVALKEPGKIQICPSGSECSTARCCLWARGRVVRVRKTSHCLFPTQRASRIRHRGCTQIEVLMPSPLQHPWAHADLRDLPQLSSSPQL